MVEQTNLSFSSTSQESTTSLKLPLHSSTMLSSPTVILPPSSSYFGRSAFSHEPNFNAQSGSSSSSFSRKRNRSDQEAFYQPPRLAPEKKRVCDSHRFALQASRKRKRPGEDFGIITDRLEFDNSALPINVLNPNKRVRPTLPEKMNSERSLVLYSPNQERAVVLYGHQYDGEDDSPHIEEDLTSSFGPPRWNSVVNLQAFSSSSSSSIPPTPVSHDLVLYNNYNPSHFEEEDNEEDSMKDID